MVYSRNRMDFNQLLGIVESKEDTRIINSLLANPKGIPISIFASIPSPLEALTKYLIEDKKLTVKVISKLLNRKPSSLYTTYAAARRKLSGRLDISSNIIVPYNLFGNRNMSISEILVNYLHTDRNLSLIEISQLLNKGYSTIKTLNFRGHQKNG